MQFHSKQNFLEAVLILSFLAIQSEAVAVGDIDLLVPNPAFADQETAATTRRISKSVAAIAAIRIEASLSLESGASLLTVNAIKDGLKASIKLVVASSEAADKAIASAKEKSCNNSAAAINEIRNGMKTARQLIFAAGLPVYYAFSAVGEITGASAKQGITLGLEYVQNAGTDVIASLNAAEALATYAIGANNAAAVKGLEAAQEAANTGYDAALASLVLGGKSAFKGLVDDLGKPEQKLYQSCGSKTSHSAEASAAIKSVQFQAELVSKSIGGSGRPATDALFQITQSIICAIQTLAAGETSALTAVSVASELVATEPELTTVIALKGLKSAKTGILNAGNVTHQGFDAAMKILGDQENKNLKLVIGNVKEVILSALEGVKIAEKLASMGLEVGGDVAEQGLKAAAKSISALFFVLYSLLVRIGEVSI